MRTLCYVRNEKLLTVNTSFVIETLRSVNHRNQYDCKLHVLKSCPSKPYKLLCEIELF